MRRKQRAGTEELGRQLFRKAEVFHLATTTEDGTAVLRVLNGVLVRNWILFHGAFAGEKSSCLDRPGVVSVHETVADIPSYFVDPEKACPATTFYRSAQAHGTLRNVGDQQLKIEMLSALMEKYQPEGKYEPFASPIYEKDLRSVRVFGLEIEELSVKVSLGQDRPTERTARVVAGLWERGKARDLPAIELLLAASPAARPANFRRQVGGEELTLCVHPDEELIRAHAELLEGQYWRESSSAAEIRGAIAASTAWIGILREDRQLLGAGRAASDDHWVATLFDVVVREDFRGQGLGKWLVQTLLEHPRVRNTRRQKLGTQDAMSFYESFGFKTGADSQLGFITHPMVRSRP